MGAWKGRGERSQEDGVVLGQGMSRRESAVGLLVRRVMAAGWFGVAAVPLVLPGGGAPPGLGQWDLKPPGDCTQERHDELICTNLIRALPGCEEEERKKGQGGTCPK